jgi:uncharacterized protein (DUF4415 family)
MKTKKRASAPISYSKKGVAIRGKKRVVTGELLSRLREGASARLKQPMREAWVDPDDAPPWTREQLEQADLYRGDKLIRAGRPPSANRKIPLKLRLDPDVVERFRESGPGWQTRINDALRRAAKLPAKP